MQYLTQPSDDEVDAFQTATRDLIGVALRSLDILGDTISIPQFRVMLVLNELGRSPSARVARALGFNASSVTRMADKLRTAGYVRRGTDDHNRSIVTLELSAAGHGLVDEVLHWRHHELQRILAPLDPQVRATAARALNHLHDVVGEEYTADLHGPLPL